MELHIYKESDIRLPRKKIQSLFNTIFDKEAKKKWRGGVNLIFSGDKRLLELNKRFRKINKTTDVLSFNIDAPETDDAIFGEVYISVPQAIRQAESYRATITEELLRLCCHGFLHLLGYDHIKNADAVVMRKKEDIYLRSI